MKLKFLYLLIIAVAIAACAKNNDKKGGASQADSISVAANASGNQSTALQTTPNWVGDYTGVLPCADCEGIDMLVTLNEDSSFFIKSTYIGKGEPFHEKGFFTFSKDLKNVIIKLKDGSAQEYLVGENTLTMLNSEGKATTGELANDYI